MYVFGDDDSAGWRDIAVDACRAAGFEPELFRSRFAYSSPRVGARMFALVPGVPELRWTSRLAVVPLQEPAAGISFHLVWREGSDEGIGAFVSSARRAREHWTWRAPDRS
jgi:hypothetical protein